MRQKRWLLIFLLNGTPALTTLRAITASFFAEALVEKLGLSQQFPQWLRNVRTLAMKTPAMASFVDSSWEITKWYLNACKGRFNWGPLSCCTGGGDCKPFGCMTTGSNCRPFGCCITGDECCTSDRNNSQTCQTLQAYFGDKDCEFSQKAETLSVSIVVQDLVTGDMHQPLDFTEYRKKQNQSHCMVHKFTRLDVGKAEIRFEVVQTSPNKLVDDPAFSRLLWDGGFSLPISKESIRSSVYHVCRTLRGVLVYDGIPDALLEGEGDLWFQYGSSRSGSRPIKVCRKNQGESHSSAKCSYVVGIGLV